MLIKSIRNDWHKKKKIAIGLKGLAKKLTTEKSAELRTFNFGKFSIDSASVWDED